MEWTAKSLAASEGWEESGEGGACQEGSIGPAEADHHGGVHVQPEGSQVFSRWFLGAQAKRKVRHTAALLWAWETAGQGGRGWDGKPPQGAGEQEKVEGSAGLSKEAGRGGEGERVLQGQEFVISCLSPVLHRVKAYGVPPREQVLSLLALGLFEAENYLMRPKSGKVELTTKSGESVIWTLVTCISPGPGCLGVGSWGPARWHTTRGIWGVGILTLTV